MRNPIWRCLKCGYEEEITDPKEIEKVNNYYVDYRTKQCESCGGEMVDLSSRQLALEQGFDWCSTFGDFVMTTDCPKVSCPRINECFRAGFLIWRR